MFAQPFIGAMDDHSDGVYAGALSPTSLVAYVSGAADGECIVWDLATRKALWSVYAHTGFVRGLAVSNDGDNFFSCGDDNTIKQWKMAAQDSMALQDFEEQVGRGRGVGAGASSSRSSSSAPTHTGGGSAAGTAAGRSAGSEVKPVNVWTGKRGFQYIDHHWKDPMFATSSTCVDVWDYHRSEPVHSFEWGADTVNTVRFNPAESSIFASTANDRSVAIYDIRHDTPLRKVVMAMTCNSLAWNPREPMNFTVACEDHNLYTFDMRKLDHALMVHRDHTMAVMDLHYSPTGREFVSGSYDRTIRIWKVDAGKSREVYHAKRMQRVFTVRWSGDAKYIISGSDDTNVRIWKARASDPIGRTLPRERAHLDYMNSLKKKFGHMPEVRKILNHRHVPKQVLSARERRVGEEQREKKKFANIRAHTKAGSREGIPEPERKKHIVGTVK